MVDIHKVIHYLFFDHLWDFDKVIFDEMMHKMFLDKVTFKSDDFDLIVQTNFDHLYCFDKVFFKKVSNPYYNF